MIHKHRLELPGGATISPETRGAILDTQHKGDGDIVGFISFVLGVPRRAVEHVLGDPPYISLDMFPPESVIKVKNKYLTKDILFATSNIFEFAGLFPVGYLQLKKCILQEDKVRRRFFSAGNWSRFWKEMGSA